MTLFISIGIGLGTLTALAFSTQPHRSYFLAAYDLYLTNGSAIRTNNYVEIFLDPEQNSSLTRETIDIIADQIPVPDGANLTIVNLAYLSTSDRCFADTSIISDTLRVILKHVSNKFFYTVIGIVTIFYTLTFVLALHRQNPRIRALKKSLNVLNKFDSYPTSRPSQTNHSIVFIPNQPSISATTTNQVAVKQTINPLVGLNHSNDDFNSKQILVKSHEQQYEMSKLLNHEDSDDQHLPSPPLRRKSTKNKKKSSSQVDNQVSLSEGTSDEMQSGTDKLNNTKQVSFQVENCHNTPNPDENKHNSISSVSLDEDLMGNKDMFYKFPCPCLTTRQFVIKIHFAHPNSKISRWLCCSCLKKRSPINHHSSLTSHNEDEIVTMYPSTSTPNNHPPVSQSETLRKQIHQHRLRQIRMASTFLLITVSFVLFYLPSVLNADRIIRSPLMIYYLYLCTHALNPIIYCFMNPSLRAYVLSVFHCRRRKKGRTTNGRTSFCDR